MTKKEKIEYVQKYIASQGTMAGLGVDDILNLLINDHEDVFGITVTAGEANQWTVTNTAEDITAFVEAVLSDPIRNIAKADLDGVVIEFQHLEYTETEVKMVSYTNEGSYSVTLYPDGAASTLVYTATA